MCPSPGIRREYRVDLKPALTGSPTSAGIPCGLAALARVPLRFAKGRVTVRDEGNHKDCPTGEMVGLMLDGVAYGAVGSHRDHV